MNNKRYTVRDRIPILRSMSLHHTRKEFAKYSGIPAPTLEAWERGTNPMSPKSGQRLLDALAKMGVSCSLEWLLYGTGVAPSIIMNGPTNIIQNIKNVPSECNVPGYILHETEAFLQSNSLSIVVMVRDDAMYPIYTQYDLVGAKQVKSIVDGLQQNVIVELNTGKFVIRRMVKGADEFKYSLVATNPNTNVSDPIIFNANIKRCYVIVWHRVIKQNELQEKEVEMKLSEEIVG